MITNLSHKVCWEFPCGSPGRLRLPGSSYIDSLMSPNVWYTFGKILKIKFDDIRGQIRKYRLSYNRIFLTYSQGPDQPHKKLPESFTAILNFYIRFYSIFGRNSRNGQWEMNFFSVQLKFEGNLYSTYAVKVFLVGKTFLTRRDWKIEKLPRMSLAVKRRLSDDPKAYELNTWRAVFYL